MNENLNPESEPLNPAEKEVEKVLRPQEFADFSGQEKVVENLRIFVKAAKQREKALDHVLLHGPPGLGKTTLAHIIAAELEVNIRITSGPVLEKPGDLAGLLTNLAPFDVLFIDEIHRLSPVVEEYLYSAMEDYRIDIMIDSGPNARSVQLKLNVKLPFLLIDACNESINCAFDARPIVKSDKKMISFFISPFAKVGLLCKYGKTRKILLNYICYR